MDKLKNNKEYSKWWGKQSGLRRFFSFSEKYHCFNIMKFLGNIDLCGKIVLEIGFGSGMVYDKIKDTGCCYIGGDISHDLVKRKNREIHEAEFMVIDQETSKICLIDSSVDILICSNVIEHVPYHDKLLCEIYRLLKPGGKLIMAVPINEEHIDVPNHLRKYDGFGINTLLTRHGFNRIDDFLSDTISLKMCEFALKKGLFNQATKKLIIVTFSIIPIKLTDFISNLFFQFGLKYSQHVSVWRK